MPIRVIGGAAKGRKLKLVPGDTARPVMDRVKESLFNILGDWVRGSRWLDLFAGTGSVGIEALSRGAEYCLFLDLSRAAITTIHVNLEITGLRAGASVQRIDALAFLANAPGVDQGFEVIYVAPPQYRNIWRKAVDLVDTQPEWLRPDGIIIAQIDPREFEPLALLHLQLYDQRKYGNSMLCFYQRVAG